MAQQSNDTHGTDKFRQPPTTALPAFFGSSLNRAAPPPQSSRFSGPVAIAFIFVLPSFACGQRIDSRPNQRTAYRRIRKMATLYSGKMFWRQNANPACAPRRFGASRTVGFRTAATSAAAESFLVSRRIRPPRQTRTALRSSAQESLPTVGDHLSESATVRERGFMNIPSLSRLRPSWPSTSSSSDNSQNESRPAKSSRKGGMRQIHLPRTHVADRIGEYPLKHGHLPSILKSIGLA